MPMHQVLSGTPAINYNRDMEYDERKTIINNARVSQIAELFQASIKQLSDALIEVQRFTGTRKLPPIQREIQEYGNGHNQHTKEYNTMLDCFAPNEVDDFYAAILQGDIEFVVESQIPNTELEIKDKSFFHQAKYSVDEGINNSRFVTHYLNNYDGNGSSSEYQAPEKYHYEKFLSNTVDLWDCGQTFQVTPLVLAVLCGQNSIVSALLKKFTTEDVLTISFEGFNLYELVWLVNPALLKDMLAFDPQAIINGFGKIWDQEPNKRGYQYQFNISRLIELLPGAACPFDLPQMHQILVHSIKSDQEYDWRRQRLHEWLLSIQFDVNQTINVNNETIMFTLFRAKAFHSCIYLLKNKPDIDLRLQNNDGKKCFEVVDNAYLFDQDNFWPVFLNNQYAKEACAFLQDGSLILHTVIRKHSCYGTASCIYDANPKLMDVIDQDGKTPFAYLRHSHYHENSVLERAKVHHPKQFVEYCIKNRMSVFFDFFISNAAPNLDAAKIYIQQNHLQDVVLQCDPKIYGQIFPTPKYTALPKTESVMCFDTRKSEVMVFRPPSPTIMPLNDSAPETKPRQENAPRPSCGCVIT